MNRDQNPRESALNTAEVLREDLEAIAASELPFADDAQRILAELDQAEGDQ